MGKMAPATNVYEQQMESFFKRKVPNEMEYIFSIAELFIYKNMGTSDLFEVYKLLGMEDFSKLVNLVDGREIRLPKKEELEDAFMSALLYFEKEINGKSWKEIKKMYPEIDISSIKYSLQIKNLDNFLIQRIDEILRKDSI
jgi:hypothetical protein